MPRQNALHFSFHRGEISPLALGRMDIENLRLAAESMLNWLPKTLGPMTIRPGLGYLGATRSNLQARVLPFIAGTTDTALLEITNTKLRIWVDDALVTRPSVSTAITNGNLQSGTGWTDASSNGGSITFDANGGTFNTGGAGGVAKLTRQVTVGVSDQGVEHGLHITAVSQFVPCYLRVGSSAGADDYVQETRLLAGEHHLAFTPTGDFHITIQCTDRYGAPGRLTLCDMDSSGVLAITSPWLTADLRKIQYIQSADVVFVACDGYARKRIERRAAHSWSVVDHTENDGPFIGKTASGVQLKVNQTYGRATVTANRDFFRSGHDGVLFRLFHEGQKFQQQIQGDNEFSDPIRVAGVQGTNYNERQFTATIAGTWSGTIKTQRSIESPDVGFNEYPRDASAGTTVAITGNTTFNNEDEDDNLIAWYRLGFEDPDWVSGAALITLEYKHGGDYGLLLLDTITNSTTATGRVLRPPRSLLYTSNWSEGAFSTMQGFPTVATIFEGRLWWFAGAQIFGSVSDNYESFDQELVGDAGPIVRTIGEGPVDAVNWALPLSRLVIGTSGAELVLLASSIDNPMTPLDFAIKPCSTMGSKSGLSAVKIDEAGFFVHRSGSRLLQIAPGDGPTGFVTRDLSVVHPEILSAGVVAIAVQRNPDTRIHLVLDDGTAVILTFDRAENVEAWSRVETGTAGVPSEIEDVAILSDEGEDAVYYVVKRTVNGSDVRYLEKWAQESQCVGGTLCRLLDSFVTRTGGSTTTVTGLSHLEGEAVYVWANSDVVQESDGAGGYQPKAYTVSSGGITLDTAATDWVIGLGYTAEWKSTKLGYAAAGGTALGQNKRVPELGLLLGTTHHRGLKFGRSLTKMDNLPSQFEGAAVTAGTIFDGYDATMIPFPGDWDTDSRIFLKGTSPYPATVLAMVVGAITNG